MLCKKHILPILLALQLVLSAGVIVYLCVNHAAAQGESVAYTLYIGLNDKDTNVQEMTTEAARATVDDICLRHVGGFTAYEAQGGWTDDDGMLVRENTLVYVFYDATEAQITAIMDEVLAALRQSAVLVSTETVRMSYYVGGGTP